MAIDLSYRSAFERLWIDKSTDVVSNSRLSHAAAVFSVFLCRAKERVAFFCKELHKEAYDDPDVLTALRRAIARGVRIEVVVQHRASFDSEFSKIVCESVETKPSQCFFVQDITGAARDLPINFTFADDHAYRVEENREKHEAVAVAWDGGGVVAELDRFFSAIKTNCEANTQATV